MDMSAQKRMSNLRQTKITSFSILFSNWHFRMASCYGTIYIYIIREPTVYVSAYIYIECIGQNIGYREFLLSAILFF